MDEKAPALRLADLLEDAALPTYIIEPAAAELRRLSAVNAELLEALERLVVERKSGLASLAAWDQARAAIAKAEGEQP